MPTGRTHDFGTKCRPQTAQAIHGGDLPVSQQAERNGILKHLNNQGLGLETASGYGREEAVPLVLVVESNEYFTRSASLEHLLNKTQRIACYL